MGRTAEARFAALREAFARARQARPDAYRETFYEFAGRLVRLCVVGRTLTERVSLPFAHLRAARPPSPRPGLTVELWDGSETAVAPAPADLTEVVEGRTWVVEGGLLASSTENRFVGYRRGHSLMWLDRESESIVGWIEAADKLTLSERSKPLPMVLPLWYRDRGVQIVHAGLVSREGRGALVAGPAGAGKSTLTLACLCAGLASLGDDHVGLEVVGDGTFVGHSLYNTTRLEARQLRLFPQLASGAVRDRGEPHEKELIVLAAVFPERLARSIATDVLVLPRLGGGSRSRSTLERASGAGALRRMAPSSLRMAIGPGQRGLDTLARLVDRAPAYWLDLGSDPGEMARQVEHLLAGTT